MVHTAAQIEPRPSDLGCPSLRGERFDTSEGGPGVERIWCLWTSPFSRLEPWLLKPGTKQQTYVAFDSK